MDTETRQKQIADVCLDIVSRRGLGALSVTEVAKKLGLATSALYRHYKDKDDMILTLMQILSEKIKADIRRARTNGRNALEKLEIILLQISAETFSEIRAFQMIIFSDSFIRNRKGKFDGIRKVFADFSREMTSVFRQGQAEGAIRRDIPPETLEVMFAGLFVSLAQMRMTRGPSFNMEKHLKQAWPLFKEMITKPAAADKLPQR